MSARALLLLLAACGLLAGLRAQNLPFTNIATVPVAEAFSGALPVVTGDVDQDGLPDILIGTTGQILFFRGTGGAHVETARIVLMGKPAGSLALGDFDGDGIPDLSVLTTGAVLVMKGEGDGRFRTPVELPLAGAAGRGLIAADLNQDGSIDLAANHGTVVALFFNDGQGNFKAGAELPAGDSPYSLVVTDFNNDGIPDLATGNFPYSDNVSILLGTGGGAFRALPPLRTGDRPRGLAPADFDRDGNMDLAVAGDGGLVVLFGDGAGAFPRRAALRDEYSPMSIASADLDANGTPDIVLGCYYSGRISVVLNNGDGTFRAAGRVLAYGDTFGLTLADLNGDSWPDLIATSYSGASALIAMGRGEGAFDPPLHLGVFDDSRLRTSGFGLAAVLPGRKAVWLLPRGELSGAFARLDDYPGDAQFGDFNGDGVSDLAVLTLRTLEAAPGEDLGLSVHVLAGREGGRFESVARLDAGPAPVPQSIFRSAPAPALATGDFNADGTPDLAVANTLSNTIRTYAGKGDGSFEPLSSVTCEMPVALAAADFDGDGIADLAALRLTLELRGIVTLYLSKGAGGLLESKQYEISSYPYGMVTGDFDGDSMPDLVIVTAGAVSTLLNTGGGAFRQLPGASFGLSYWRGALTALADFNGDGKTDLAIVNAYRAREGMAGSLLLLGNGDGTFQPAGSLGIPLGAAAATALDWDGDGSPELAVLDGLSGSLNVYR